MSHDTASIHDDRSSIPASQGRPPTWLFPFCTTVALSIAGALCLNGHVDDSGVTSP